MNSADTRDNGVTVGALVAHSKTATAVPHKFIEFHEGSCVKEQVNALARSELALSMLPLLRGYFALGDSLVKTRFVFRNSVSGT